MQRLSPSVAKMQTDFAKFHGCRVGANVVSCASSAKQHFPSEFSLFTASLNCRRKCRRPKREHRTRSCCLQDFDSESHLTLVKKAWNSLERCLDMCLFVLLLEMFGLLNRIKLPVVPFTPYTTRLLHTQFTEISLDGCRLSHTTASPALGTMACRPPGRSQWPRWQWLQWPSLGSRRHSWIPSSASSAKKRWIPWICRCPPCDPRQSVR